MEAVLKKIAKKHKDWVRMVVSFGCPKSLAEDIVQEMYLKINVLLEGGLDISYKDDINYFYIYKTLKSMYYILSAAERKVQKINIDNLKLYIKEEGYVEKKDTVKAMKQLKEVLDSFYWYDRKVFEIISNGVTVAELSRQTGISYASLYNTYTNTKKILKENIKWD
tara:strand:- start:366 stop:863 length:498 start_codon:yes stop_codon:yes gene_type:complete